MKLPNLKSAIIPPEKITAYLLSETHPEGHDKAVFFSRFGFRLSTWEVLAQALLDPAGRHDVVKAVQSRFGTRYVIEGELQTPDGRTPQIRAIWFITMDSDAPRLVTAYPL